MKVLRIFENHPHWQDIVEVLRRLHAKKHKAYLAGGCLRDALLDRVPHDFDVATSARPDEVHKIFPNAIDVGRAFGVMIIPFETHQIEIATFRNDGEYKDGRHPIKIEFSDEKEDALRRDFTVNALFYDTQKNKVIDYVDGLQDLELRQIKAVGDAEQRFSEDKLRILRAARFVSQLDFKIESNTLKAMTNYASELHLVSKERITQEFKKIAKCNDQTRSLQVIFETRLLQKIWPEAIFNDREIDDQHDFLRSLFLLSPIHSFEILVSLFVIFQKLRDSQNFDEREESWVKSSPFILTREERRTIDFLWKGYFKMQVADDEALLLLNDESGPLLSEICFVMTHIGRFKPGVMGELIERFLLVADQKGELPQPFLDGQDLLDLGVKPSPKMKELLNGVYFAQIRGELHNKKEAQDWVLLRLGS